jgi:NADP-dependent alcohol dehydrogenase
MNNFQFYNPVKVEFGRGAIAKLSAHIPAGSRVMVTYGGGSIKSNGVYDAVFGALSGFDVVEFGGIEPNPAYETLIQAVALARSEKVDFLLAVGGGSVIDGTKFIAAAIPFDGDPWNILVRQAKVGAAVPLGAVLTLPATGSEMNNGAVITKHETKEKYAFHSPAVFPQFSILDPEYTYSLPKAQIANGTIDAFIHVMEQYMTYPAAGLVQDRWSEGLLQSLIELGPKALANPTDYDVRANLMWAATMALNGIIVVGMPADWATHMIGHELTALHGLAHGVTLAIAYPAMLDVMFEEKKEKLAQYAERVWGITSGSADEKARAAIAKTEEFFRSLGVPTHLKEYGIGNESFQAICSRFTERGWTAMGERQALTPERVLEVLNKSL